jgi:uncharacterized OB-fold protein
VSTTGDTATDNNTVGPLRVPPQVTASSAEFWAAGGKGRLVIPRCRECRTWLLPPAPVCRVCRSTDIAGEEASGDGVVMAYTVNRQQWNPAGRTDPYVIALVELPEQEHLRLISNVVGCPIEDVRVGLPVHVRFEPLADVWIPLFEPR